MAKISHPAKVLYYKLLSVVDDFGRFEADPELLLRRLYMWELESVCAKDLAHWLHECVSAELAKVYQVKGKAYVEIQNFKQQARSKSKYPDTHGIYTEPPKRGRADTADVQTDVNSCEQVRADVAGPVSYTNTHSQTNSEDSLPEESTRETKLPVSELGIEGWGELTEVAAEAQMSFDPSPASDACQKIWRWFDFGKRRAAIDGIRARIQCGEYSDPGFVPTLENYLRGQKWRASLRAPPRLVDKRPPSREARAREVFKQLREELANGSG